MKMERELRKCTSFNILAQTVAPSRFTFFPWQRAPERSKHVIKRPCDDHIVVHATEEGDNHHGKTNAC